MVREEIINKVLSQTDVDYRLAFPTASLWGVQIPEDQNGMEFEATSAGNIHEHWNFRLCLRNSNNGERYRKPELTGDWLQFVRSKSLCKGNKIILTMELDEATGERSYTIRAETKLMGSWVPIA
ncbi:hypothetical protein MANES_07G021100v8 [Manihot esculenta]|uniref:TF-B3 domain-containing protein n=1 Tax=Manihot esculenta TaxID=3983 RepID=A0A2C9VHR9_MANES|nr:hypothetical protein MANES_07G021100v8 [Manihot esculenta]